MSRSYREPWVTDGYKGSKRKQFFKRYANKVVRRSIDVANGKAYRKFFEQWEICDYRWYESPESMKKWTDKPWQVLRK